MTLRKTKFNIDIQDIEVLGYNNSTSKIKNSSFKEFINFSPQPGKLYFTTRAISARVNRNFDGFPSEELKKYHHTFRGRPYFVNHANTNYKRTRGIILDSIFKEDGRDKYIKLLCSINAQAFPRLAQEIIKGNLDGVSMGVDVEKTICSFCHRIARAPEDFCDHILYHKGQKLERINSNGKKERVLVFESCYGLNFFELSSVFDPADETALVQEVLLPKMSSNKEINKKSFGETTAPPQVDTLREESNCPNCGDEGFDGNTCQWCGYNAPPAELQDPDLDLAKKIDRNQQDSDNIDSINEQDNSSGGSLSDVIQETIENLEGLFELEQVVQQFAEGVSPQQDYSPEDEDYTQYEEQQPQENIEEQDNDPYLEGQDQQQEEYPEEQPENIEQQDQQQEQYPDQDLQEQQEDNSEMSSIEQQVQDLVEGVNILVQEISGQSETGEEENPEMSKTTSRRAPALSSVTTDRIAQAKEKLNSLQRHLADLSQNVGLADGEEAIADTPPAEAGTSSTEKERNGEDARTNVQDLDANPATREKESNSAERQSVEIPTRAVAKLGTKDINSIFSSCDSKYSEFDLGTALAKASYDFARQKKVSAQNILAQVLIAAQKTKSNLNSRDLKSLSSISESFVKRIKGENDDIYDMMSNKDNLELAKPTDRVDVEAPVEDDTNDYAQASQFDPDKFDNNRGAPVAKPDDVHTMNWWPGEKPTLTSSMKIEKSSAVDAIKLAETYIELGVISPNLKFDKIAEFENMPKIFVQQQQLALDAVRRCLAHQSQKPRGIVPRAANGQRPIAQMGRAASFEKSSSNDDMLFLAL